MSWKEFHFVDVEIYRVTATSGSCETSFKFLLGFRPSTEDLLHLSRRGCSYMEPRSKFEVPSSYSNLDLCKEPFIPLSSRRSRIPCNKSLSGVSKTSPQVEMNLLDSKKLTSEKMEHEQCILFKNLTDLQDFDVSLRHHTPIGAYELEFILSLEDTTKMDEWDCTVNREYCRVYKKKGDAPVVLVKAFAAFRNIPTAILAYFVQHIPTRKKWDTTFEDFRLVEKDIEENELIYCVMRAPWPVANRDFLQWRRIETKNDGTVTIMMRSASHPDFPEIPGVIRAETIISGYVIRSTDETTTLFIVAQTDVRGLIPKLIQNRVAQRAPLYWCLSLEQACQQYIKRHGTVCPDYFSNESADFSTPDA